MSELFPELDRNFVSHLLQGNIRVGKENRDLIEIADCLSSLGIVATSEHQYINCVDKDDHDFRDRNNINCMGRVEFLGPDRDYYCPKCGQPMEGIENKKRYVEYVVRIRREGIKEYLYRVFQSLDFINEIDEIGREVFRLLLGSKDVLKVIMPELAELQNLYGGIFFAEPTLYIFTSPVTPKTMNALEEKQCLELSEFLSQPQGHIMNKVSSAAIPIEGRLDLSSVEASFDDMLDRHNGDHSWQFFEQDFIPCFIKYLIENPKAVIRYLDKLRKVRSTVFGEYYVPIGGSGVTDLRAVDKYGIMSELLEGDFIGDAKCYVESTLNYDALKSVNAHLNTDPTDPQKAIVFVAGNDVSATAWDFVFKLKDRSGTWKITIIPKYLLLEMINELDALSLLEM